eukprot:3170652-Prorocentrum_lima.AAC.1
MTSSLVGSEMCIRDSSTRPLPVADRQDGCRHFLVKVVEAPVGLALQGLCLLYTSDAADDM